MKIGTLTLARLLETPEPEFPCCTRCNNDMPQFRESAECSDCEGAAKYHPAYEVSLHYDQHPRHCPTIGILEAQNTTYMVYTAKRDSIEVEWAKGLLNPELPVEWPIVLISAHGQYVDHWAGFDLQALNNIPAARAAAIHQNTEAFLTRVPSRELVAAA